MPAWQVGRHIGVKMVTVFPDNAEMSLPAVMGIYVLLDGKSGSPHALIDGPTLTVRRTAGASALASSYLRSEEHTSELQSLMRISYAVFCLKKKNHIQHQHHPATSS